MNPAVIFLPSRMVSLESVIWTMRAITPSSRLRVIQSSWPSGPATNPSTVICTCSLSFRVAIRECPGSWSHLCVESTIPESTFWGLLLRASLCDPTQRKRNVGVAFKGTCWYDTQHNCCMSTNGPSTWLRRKSTHGGQSPSAQRHDEHRSDRKTGRAPRPTYAGVERPHQRGRVWNLVPRQTRGRIRRWQADPRQDGHPGLRACDPGTTGRAHRCGAVLLVSLAPLRRRP